jgi:hypothetical protein
LTDSSETKIAPGAISSFFATVSESGKFDRLIGNKNRAEGDFVIFRDGVGIG